MALPHYEKSQNAWECHSVAAVHHDPFVRTSNTAHICGHYLSHALIDFGLVIYRVQRKNPAARTQSVAEKRFLRWQMGLLTSVITIGVVGSTFLITKGSGSTTLGHVTLFLILFQAAAVIGAMELNVGWLAAAGVWLLTALAIYSYPVTLHLFSPFKDEDLWVGLAMSLGFILIGVFPQRVDRERPDTCGDRGREEQGDRC